MKMPNAKLEEHNLSKIKTKQLLLLQLHKWIHFGISFIMNNTTMNSTITTLAPQEEDDESFTTNWDAHLENIIFFAVGIVIVATAIWQRNGIKGLFSGVANDPTNHETTHYETNNYETTNDNEMTNFSAPLGQSPPEDPTNNKLEDLQLESSKAELTTLPTSLDTTTTSLPPIDQESGLVNASQQQQQQNTFGSNNNNNDYSNATTAAGQRPQQPQQFSNQHKKTGGLFYRLIGRLPQSDQ